LNNALAHQAGAAEAVSNNDPDAAEWTTH
jgi:hypothetical protein